MELPAQVEPARLARQGRVLRGIVPVTRLVRLSAELADDEGAFLAELAFGREPDGRSALRIRVEGVVSVICQRCLENMSLELKPASTVLLTSAEDGAVEDASMDTHVMDDEYLDVFGVIEEELLLALPFAPTHPPRACSVGVPAAAPGRHRPFAELQRLKR